MSKKVFITLLLMLIFASFAFPWYSQLFPFSAGSYDESTVNFNSRNWRLNDYSYAGYNLGETPLQTGIPCNVQVISGTGDITSELQNKINTAGAAGGGIVKIPAGTYTITSVDMGTGLGQRAIGINYNNVSVEGAGSGYTIINVPATHSYDEAANSFEGTFSIEKGYFAWNKGWTDPSTTLCTVNNTINEGSTYITGLSNLAAVNTGSWVLIIQYYWATLVANNGNGAWSVCPGTCGGGTGREYAFSYLRKVLAKDASGITIDAPIPYTLNPANNAINIKDPGVNSGMIMNSGVSGMTIQFADNNNSATQARPSGCAVYFEGALNCWVKDVNVFNFPRYGICVEYSARVTVADTCIKKSQDFGGGGNGYGFFNTCSQNTLFKNCVGEEARHNFIVSRAISSYVVMTHCRSIDSREGEDTHFSLAHAILRDDYTQSNGNDLNGYNRGSTSGGAYESYLSGALWNCSGDGYGGIYYGGTINITPSNDGSAIIVGGPGQHAVYDGSYYDNGGTYHPGDVMPSSAGLQVGPGPNGTRKNVLYEGLGSTGLSPQSLYEEQLKNRLGSAPALWANVCSDAPTFTPVPTNTPVLTPGVLVYDSDHPAWGAGTGSGAPTMLNTLTPGNNIDDQGHNRTINGLEAIRYTATGSDWAIMTQFSGPALLTSNMNRLDFWVYPTAANLNFRVQLQNFAAGVPASLGSSVIASGALADGGAFTVNTWNHVAIPIASFGYSGAFNGIDIRVNTNTAGNTFWLDDIYFITNTVPTTTNTPVLTATFTPSNTRTATFTSSPSYTNTRTPTPSCTITATRTQTPTFTFTVTLTKVPDTQTFTPTRTATATPPGTSTFTPTFTNTNSRTPTPTFTDTAFPTFTFTATRTNTYTPTRTQTMTFTATPTVSPTPPGTLTFTPTFTNTSSRTPTPTFTDTALPTFTFTATRTNTYTPTRTQTMTFTATPTISPTPPGTLTFTPTFTNTSSRTPTPTYTDTAPPTFTFTATRTNTYTPTRTQTMTFTATPTISPTQPGTLTFTPTFTGTRSTITNTQTPTGTRSPVIDTPTTIPTTTHTPPPTFTSTYTPCTCPSFFGNTQGTQPPIDLSGFFDSDKFVLAENALVHSLSANIAATTGGKMKMALYADSGGGVPSAIMGQSAEKVVTTGWNSFEIPLMLLSPGTYWIAWQAEPGISMSFENTASGDEAWAYMTYGLFPVTAPATNPDVVQFTVKADYCPLACPPPTMTFTPTATRTSSIVPSPSPTGTSTPVFTGTPTPTDTRQTIIDTPTFTPTTTNYPPPTFTPTPTSTPVTVTDIGPYPNPVNPGTGGLNIAYNLSAPGKVWVLVYTGGFRLVRKVDFGARPAGFNTDIVAADRLKNLSSGVYYYVIISRSQTGVEVKTKPGMIIIYH